MGKSEENLKKYEIKKKDKIQRKRRLKEDIYIIYIYETRKIKIK